MRRVRKTIIAVEKQYVSYIFVCVCVWRAWVRVWMRGRLGRACACPRVALLIQHAKRMRRVLLSSVASLAPSYFQHYLINGTIFEKKTIKCKM